MPGPDALRRLIAAAEKRDAPGEVVARAAEAVAQFEDLIRNVAGDRGGLDSIVSAWLPDAREKVEMVGRQAVFRGMSTIKGAAADINLSTAILHPCADGNHHDAVWITGAIGLRRLRPGAVVKFGTRRIHRPTDSPSCDLDGNPIEDLTESMLDEFCSSPPSELTVRREGDSVHYVLAGERAGLGSTVDVLVAEMVRCCASRYQSPGEQRKRGPFAFIGTPVTEVIFDALLHEDVYPGSEPMPVIYDTSLDGPADANDPGRDIDRLGLSASIQMLGRGPSTLRSAEFPHYVEMVQHVMEKMGWGANRFRAYRCRMRYPVYGSQIHMLFDAPERADP